MRRIAVCLSMLVLLGGASFARGPLSFVYTSYVPANFQSAQGDHRGFFVEIIREALETRMKVPVSMSVYPWPRCQYMVREGVADMMATIPTPERRTYSIVVETPIWIKRYRVFTVPGHPSASAMDGIRSVEDLKRSGLVVLSYDGNDWSRTVLGKAGVKVVKASSVEGMYRMLIARRGDLIIEDDILVWSTVRGLGIADRIRRTSGFVGESAFHLMIGKASPFASIAADLDRTLRAMYADGAMERILRSYR